MYVPPSAPAGPIAPPLAATATDAEAERASAPSRTRTMAPKRMRHGRFPLPAMQLVYCRDTADFVRCAGAIGRYLIRHGKPVVIVDANGPLPDLAGIYSEARGRKYFKGPHPPRLADLTETEMRVLPHMVMARVIARALITTWRAEQFPDNEPYIMRNTHQGWAQLDWFLARSMDDISDLLA